MSLYCKQLLSSYFNDVSSIKRISMAQAHIEKYGLVPKELNVKKCECGCYRAERKSNESCSFRSFCMIGTLNLTACSNIKYDY